MASTTGVNQALQATAGASRPYAGSAAAWLATTGLGASIAPATTCMFVDATDKHRTQRLRGPS
jgi:hypothetical protein